jgi:hypothetical protein
MLETFFICRLEATCIHKKLNLRHASSLFLHILLTMLPQERAPDSPFDVHTKVHVYDEGV